MDQNTKYVYQENAFENLVYKMWAILFWPPSVLTHWGRVTHICVSKLTIIGSDNGLSPGWRQAIIYTNAGLISIRPLGTHFSESLIKIQNLSFTKMHLKISAAKWQPSCCGLNVLKVHFHVTQAVMCTGTFALRICQTEPDTVCTGSNLTLDMQKLF